MNRLMDVKWPWIEGAHLLRAQLLESLTNEDLAFSPGGSNMPLGTLLREAGDVEYSYIQSLKTFKQDWSYHNPEPGLEGDVEKIKSWYAALDQEMKATIEAFSDDDLARPIERGSGLSLPLDLQVEVYLQAQLIYLGKAGVYFRAMHRELPQLFQDYIG